MSGDVQPKKRRDKRKKKEDQIEETVAHQQAAPAPTIPIDDTNIHVHKEKSIGGGICAKCIFFIITIAIAIIIGLTITEHRGLTDIDIPLSESRFASIFEGWIDTERSDDHDEGIESDEVSFDHDDDDSHEAEENDDDDEGVGSQEEEESTEETEQEETEQEETQEEDEEEDTVESEEEQEESEEPEESPEQAESPEEEEDDESSQEQESQEEIEKSEEQESEEQEEQPAQSDEESQEQPTTVDDDDDEDDNEPDQPGSNEVDQDAQDDEPQEEIEDPQADGVADATTSGVAAKFGVGVALLIVAYVVLIKKWKSDNLPEEPKTKTEDESPNLSRRNTFIPPPRLEEVEQDMDNVEEEYSEDEDIEESDEEVHVPASIRQYEELRATYTRSLTPEVQLVQTEEQYDEEVEEEIEEEEEEYDDEREEVEYNDDEDEELMKKLEEKYGRIVKGSKYEDEERDEEGDEEEEEEDEDYDSWKRIKGIGDNAAGSESDDEPQRRSGAQSYELDNITNAYDYPIREDLDYAEQHLRNNIPLALNLFIKILEVNPDSPRALYGRARSLDHLAEKKRSNEILQESIKYFFKVLKVKTTPDALFLATADRCIDRMRFVGSYSRAIEVHNLLIERFPDDIKYRNDLSVTLLTINRISQARKLLLETLKIWPNNGFALVHYGFILKTVDNNLPLAIDYLTRGINTKEPGVVDGRFYFHLGDALSRSGQNDLAMKVYEDGVLQKVFLSKYQRSLYNVDKLTGRPWWSPDQTPYTKLFQLLQHHWRDIKKEGLDVLDKKGYFKDEAENLRDVGDWKQFELYARGVKNKENCGRCPLTCQIIDSFPEAKTCTRGQVKFSVMHPGTHVWPHCGPTNCRLRSHLGLKVPPRTYIRVAEEIRSWEEGKVFIFDDSFEHEVWHNGTDFRLVLIVDVWHPELTKSERSNLSPI